MMQSVRTGNHVSQIASYLWGKESLSTNQTQTSIGSKCSLLFVTKPYIYSTWGLVRNFQFVDEKKLS
ncbi:Uncharacterized protein TCM_014722 [Theobroma cacao]|uniref:Uncharacterized protein n=1 Tax=Theobroma cacao TaxID=3641 RepID=A0A061G080_THECC|nr:Uncharacterized protein TCM_014722 [Theobroma cacao]